MVYDVDGLRDSVKQNKTGIICTQNTPQNLSEAIIKGFDNINNYELLRNNAWKWSSELTLEKTYVEFCKKINIL